MRFATSDLPSALSDQERALAWADALGGNGGHFQLQTPDVTSFFGVVEIKAWGELQLGSALVSSVGLVRNDARIASDGDDRILLVINRGHAAVQASQHGREIDIHPGGLALFDMAAQSECSARRGGHLVHVLLPREAFVRPLATEAFAAPLDGRSEAGRLLRDVVASLLRRDLADPTVLEPTIAYLATLIRRLADGARREIDHPHAINRARLKRTRELIEARFGDPAFCIRSAAASVGVSPRHLQSLFAMQGETFSDCLSARRLDAAYRALCGPADNREPIAEIADRCGFADISTFYRRFAARYGRSPARARAEHGLSVGGA